MSCEHDHDDSAVTAHLMKTDRRDALLKMLFTGSMLGLRSLATGLPISFLMNPRKALAQSKANYDPTYLIVATSGAGDAMNANAPGTYEDPGIVHPCEDERPDQILPGFEAANLQLGGTTVKAAKVWADNLSADVRSRATFFHHATLTANHGDEPRVLKLMGAVRRDEMLASLISRTLQPALNTIQAQGIPLNGEVLQYANRYQPRLQPTGLRSVVSPLAADSLAQRLQKMRDTDLDAMNEVLKGSRKTAHQRAYMDSLAASQAQVRKLGDQFATDLAALTANNQTNEALAAALLLKMGVTPYVQMHLSFSGDNHTDNDWNDETTQTAASIGVISALYAKLKEYEMMDKVTFAVLNVFGRTLGLKKDGAGRDHNSAHNVSMIVGPAINPGVVGAVTTKGSTPINSTSGAGGAGGDISIADSLASMGKTLARACGVDDEVIEDQITQGKWVQGALKPAKT